MSAKYYARKIYSINLSMLRPSVVKAEDNLRSD